MLFDKTIKDAGVVVSDAALEDPTVATTVRGAAPARSIGG